MKFWKKQIQTYEKRIEKIKEDLKRELFYYCVILIIILWAFFICDIIYTFKIMKG